MHRISDHDWEELSITYDNAPDLGSIGASSDIFSSNNWTEVDVTSLVTSGGVVDFALTTNGTRAINLASRESGANAPQLVIEID